eukprot:scpid40446/ scgid1469/ Tetratricopeptide repeat protein 8; Bardet-Biedl syndrome 8 protein homolog
MSQRAASMSQRAASVSQRVGHAAAREKKDHPDKMLKALNQLRRRKFEECVETCGQILLDNPFDKAAWILKMQALTAQTYVDEVEVDEVGIAELLMDDTVTTATARPGTSFRNPLAPKTGARSVVPETATRPVSQSGRPVTGFARPGTQSGRPTTMEQAVRTARSASTARPVTTSSGRFVRLGTASMISEKDGPFVNPAKLDLEKYAKKPELAKPLFEYFFYNINDIRNAMNLAQLVTQQTDFKEWWWKAQLGKCYFRVGLIRKAEAQFKASLKVQDMIDTYLHLGKVYIRLDHPFTAIECYQKGLRRFPGEVSLLIAIARVHEGLKDSISSKNVYRDVLHQDNLNVEASACLATNYFYSDQPEMALQFYRRLVLMGVSSTDIYNNLALCCFYSHNYESAFACFDRALGMANDEEMADVWYNIGCVCVSMCALDFATYAFKLSLAANSNNAESYNNLGVLCIRQRKTDMAKQMFSTSIDLNPTLYEANYNKARLLETFGDFAGSYSCAEKALEGFPDHFGSKCLLENLKSFFSYGA